MMGETVSHGGWKRKLDVPPDLDNFSRLAMGDFVSEDEETSSQISETKKIGRSRGGHWV